MNKKIITILITSFSVLLLNNFVAAQQPEPNPTPTPFRMQPASCVTAGVDQDTLIRNGDFEFAAGEGLPPLMWTTPQDHTSPITMTETITNLDGEEVINHFLMMESGSGISQRIAENNTVYTKFKVKFCGIIINGQVQVTLGGRYFEFPSNPLPDVEYIAQFETQEIALNVGAGDLQDSTLIITFTGEVAYIDNVQVIPFISSSDGDQTPNPTPEPTPEPTEPAPTAGPTFTPNPTLRPGQPTPTPTPGLQNRSLQVIADPPMLLVSPDDFAGVRGNVRGKKESLLTWQVIGADGKPIDITKIDPDARVEIFIDDDAGVGSVWEVDQRNNTYRQLRGEEKVSDVGYSIPFIPTYPYDGVVRVIVRVEYEADVNNRKQRIELQEVAPIVMRTDPRSSLTGATGTFNPALNFNLGRKPGDRGFRPDARTNLFFRERLD